VTGVSRHESLRVERNDRAKWFRNIPEHKPTEAIYIGSFTAENGTSTKGRDGRRFRGVRSQRKTVAGSAPVKRTMSISARRKIAAAQRARWAKVKAVQKKAD
jgi:hypothetical protein